MSQVDPAGEPQVTTAKPPARYGARVPGGIDLLSYTITGDTTLLCHHHRHLLLALLLLENVDVVLLA